MPMNIEYSLIIRRLEESEQIDDGEDFYPSKNGNYALKFNGERLGVVPRRVLNTLIEENLRFLGAIGMSKMTIEGKV